MTIKKESLVKVEFVNTHYVLEDNAGEENGGEEEKYVVCKNNK